MKLNEIRLIFLKVILKKSDPKTQNSFFNVVIKIYWNANFIKVNKSRPGSIGGGDFPRPFVCRLWGPLSLRLKSTGVFPVAKAGECRAIPLPTTMAANMCILANSLGLHGL